MTTPRIDPITGQPFNLLAYLPLVALLIAGAGAWGSVTADSRETTVRLAALETRVDEGVQRGLGRETRIQHLETAVASMQASLTHIGSGVERIERAVGVNP